MLHFLRACPYPFPWDLHRFEGYVRRAEDPRPPPPPPPPGTTPKIVTFPYSFKREYFAGKCSRAYTPKINYVQRELEINLYFWFSDPSKFPSNLHTREDSSSFQETPDPALHGLKIRKFQMPKCSKNHF